jgi:hypothetical protein
MMNIESLPDCIVDAPKIEEFKQLCQSKMNGIIIMLVMFLKHSSTKMYFSKMFKVFEANNKLGSIANFSLQVVHFPFFLGTTIKYIYCGL